MARTGRGLNVGEVISNAIKLVIGLAIAGAVVWFGLDFFKKSGSPNDDAIWVTMDEKTFKLAPGETRSSPVNITQDHKYEFEVKCIDGEVLVGVTGTRTGTISKEELGAVSTKPVKKGSTGYVGGWVQKGNYYTWVVINSSSTSSASVTAIFKRRK